MIKQLILILLLCLTINSLNAQVKVFKEFDSFKKEYLQHPAEDTVYVINFWATWCVPCIKELPYFEALHQKSRNQPTKVLLVSLDNPDDMNSRLIPFIKKKGLKSNVVLLADGNANKWIDQIDPNWSGAIPITLFLKGNNRAFYEKPYHSLAEIEKDLLKIKTSK